MKNLQLVLLPGFDGTGKMFQPLLPLLSSKFDPYVIEYPASGPQDYDSLLVLIQNRLPRTHDFVVVAESFSGPLAAQLALKKPPNLRGIVFCASFLRAPICIPKPLIKTLGSLIFRVPIPELMLRYFLLGLSADREITTLMKDSLKQTTPSSLAARLEAVLKLKPISLREVAVPTLFLWPTEDRLIPPKASRELSNLCAQSVRIHAPHCVLQREPQISFDEISKFCNTFYNTN